MKFRSFSKTIQIRLVLQFISTIGSMSILPYIIIFFSGQLGTTITGFMFLGVMGANILGLLAGGYLSDLLGRKSVIVRAELVVSIGYALVALMNSTLLNEPYVTFILFLFIFICSGMAGPAYSALIIDESNPENRKEVYTISYWLNNLAVAIGGLIGAFLFQDYHFYLFLGMSMIALLSVIITFYFIEDNYRTVEMKELPEKKGTKGSLIEVSKVYTAVIKDRAFAALALANLLIIAVESQLTSFIGLRLTDDLPKPVPLVPFLDINVNGFNLVGILKAENTILVVCLTVVVSLLLKRLKDRSVLLGGVILFFCGYTIISFTSVPIVLILAMFIATLGELIHIPVKQALLANMVPSHARSSYMAVYGLLSMSGALTAGVFIFLYGRVPTLFLSVVIGIMGLSNFIIFWKLTSTTSTANKKTNSIRPSKKTNVTPTKQLKQ